MFTVNPRSTTPLYEQLEQNIISMIASGILAADDQLPSVRSLARDLGLNPNTVQKAYRLMEEEGIVVTPPNAVSVVHWDDEIFRKIKKELTAGLVSDFVVHAKANGLTLEAVMELLQEEWGESDEKCLETE